MAATFVPGRGPCLRCIFEEAPPPGTTPTCDTAGVLGGVVSVIASIQAVEALKILSGHREAVMVHDYADVPRDAERVIFFPRAAGG